MRKNKLFLAYVFIIILLPTIVIAAIYSSLGFGLSSITNPPVITTYLSPYSGPIGTTVKITGTGFTPTDNDINFAGANKAITGLNSTDGKTLVFNVPATPCPPRLFCAQVVLKPGIYQVSVTNVNGSSNITYFKVNEN